MPKSALTPGAIWPRTVLWGSHLVPLNMLKEVCVCPMLPKWGFSPGGQFS